MADATAITTLVFDIDDTLYDVGSGFTAHRNGESVYEFMTSQLGFESAAAAKLVRDEYFERYHSTVKALTVAEAEGRLPEGAHFEASQLSSWWADSLEFGSFLRPNPPFIESLRRCPLNLVAFSNAPRKYAIRVLTTLGLRELFPDDRLFCVEDVMPACKPEAAAFDHVLRSVGASPSEAVMVEDSMKNIRAAKAIGMRTVLVSGVGADRTASEATKPGDAPLAGDPAVDVVLGEVCELEKAMPGLWRTPATF